MKATITIVGVSAALLLGGIGCSRNQSSNSVTNPDPNTFTPTGTVNGVLVDAITNTPVAGATVAIMSQTATTGTDGQFTITNVPAVGVANTTNSAGNFVPTPYPVVIDLTSYNSKLAAGAVKYPNIVLSSVAVTYSSLGDGIGGSSNHATPVNGFVANMTPTVGHLDANLKVLVVNAGTMVPAVGATVTLTPTSTTSVPNSTATSTSGNSGNNASGNTNNVAATATTDANGIASFSAVEAGRVFIASALTSDGNWQGNMTAQAPGDGITKSYVTPNATASGTCIDLTAIATKAPYPISVTPAAYSDIAPGATSVMYTFSEPIAATGYALATTQATSTQGGLWADIASSVTYNGAKAGQLPFSLTWNTAMTQLSVNFTTVAASKYSVSIAAALGSGKLTDAYKNVSADTNGVASMTFTTNGTLTPGKPAIWQDSNTATPNYVEWLPTANTYQYVVQVTRMLGAVVDDVSYIATPNNIIDVTTINPVAMPTATTITAGTGGFQGWSSSQVPYTYNVNVYAVPGWNASNYLVGGTASNTLTFTNNTRPTMAYTAAGSTLPAGGSQLTTATTNYTVVFTFTTPIYNTATAVGPVATAMSRASVESTNSWAVIPANSPAAGIYTTPTATGIAIPKVTNVLLDPNGLKATVTITTVGNSLTSTWDPSHLQFIFSGSDITGQTCAKQNYDGAVGVVF